MADWNPPGEARERTHDELYALYLELYGATRPITHTLVGRELRLPTDSREKR